MDRLLKILPTFNFMFKLKALQFKSLVEDNIDFKVKSSLSKNFIKAS